jgi:hypothetical protein
MTIDARFERELSGILEDLYLGPTPDYRTEVLSAATARRQRPAWTFPGRWFLTSAIAVRPIAVPQLPVRLIGVALLIVATLLAILVVAGSRQPKLPPPYGAARNGVITWALGGDIFVGDPATGQVKRVVATDDIDRNPQFSRDGSHLVFLRQVPTQAGMFDLVVMESDGNGAKVLTPVPITTPDQVQWSPDGTFLLVNEANGDLTRFSLDGTSPQLLMRGVHVEPDAFRPPNGSQILHEREDDQRALYVMNLDGSGVVQLFGGRTAPCACAYNGPARWSPDGRHVAFPVNINGLVGDRLFVIDADGENFHQLDDEDGLWYEGEAAWSPDGTRIAFNRWQGDDTGHTRARPIGIADLAGGPVMSVGVAPADGGDVIEWAPDGRSLMAVPSSVVNTFSWGNQLDGSVAKPVMIDVSTGVSTLLDWSVGSAVSWQRLAP